MFFMKSAIFNGPDVQYLQKRLLRNQSDIGNFLGSFPGVGTHKSHALTFALQEHIRLAAAAIVSGGAQDQVQEFLRQGNEVAACVTALNPNKLHINMTRKAFRAHNKHVLKLATILMKSEFRKETRAYDEYFEHMLEVADAIFFALHTS
jgi:hypothetical protein